MEIHKLVYALATNIFGTLGKNKNAYNELYNSYLDDPFVTSKWTGDYALNVYQQGNPFLTNVDLSLVAKGDNVSDDENAISNLNGIYYYTSGLQTNSFGTTYSNVTGVKVTFDSNGNIVGGFADDLVIKPMQDFIVKLNSDAIQTLKFNKTRRFAQTARNSSTAYSVTAARMSSLVMLQNNLLLFCMTQMTLNLGERFML
jgi:hypothetical protein